jgi:DNA-binding transcriptional ArsR family regulator
MSQHFKILREAGLICSERKGVELKNSTRCHEIKKKYEPTLCEPKQDVSWQSRASREIMQHWQKQNQKRKKGV